jgi:scyllo-inositol 2-dehydrogenase (NADP+)
MPRAVTADIITQRIGAKVEDYFHLVLDYAPLRVILHSGTLVPHPGPRFTVHGNGGSFLKYGLDGQEDALKQGLRPGEQQWGADQPEYYGELTPAGGVSRKVETLRGGYEKFYEGLADCLLTGTPPPVDARDSRNGLIVIEAAQLSAAQRRTVAISA